MREPEGAALAVDAGALGHDRAVHQLRQAAADGQAEARAAVAPRDRQVALAERLEEADHALRRDADAGVLDLGHDLPAGRSGPSRAPGQLVARDAQHDLAALGELDGVGEHVEDDLAEASGVAGDRARQVVVEGVGQLDALGRRRRGQDVERALDALAEREGLRLELDLAGLDLGEVEDVVDDREQRLGGGVDRLGEVALLLVERRVEEQAAHADDGVHRGPDLVAHGGQEGALGLVGLLGRLLGRAAVLEQPGVLDGDGGLLGKADQEGQVGAGEARRRARSARRPSCR